MIEIFLAYIIPIFFIEKKSTAIEEKTFQRSLIQALKKTRVNYTNEYLEPLIFCTNDKIISIFLLLEKIIEELNTSKLSHNNSIKIYVDNHYINEAEKEFPELGDEYALENGNKFFNEHNYSINNA